MKELHDPTFIQAYIHNLDPRLPIKDCHYKLIEFSSGEHLCQQGERLEYLYVLIKGKVKIYTTSANGKRLITAFNRPVELFGDIELIQKVAILNTVEAVGTVHVLAIPIYEVQPLLHNTLFLQYLLETVTRKFHTKSTTLSFHLLHEVDVRLASYLLSITHDEIGQMTTAFIAKRDLKEVAEFIGTSVRHQNRVLQHFEQLGVIERVPSGLLLKEIRLLKNIAQNNIYEMQ